MRGNEAIKKAMTPCGAIASKKLNYEKNNFYNFAIVLVNNANEYA